MCTFNINIILVGKIDGNCIVMRNCINWNCVNGLICVSNVNKVSL